MKLFLQIITTIIFITLISCKKEELSPDKKGSFPQRQTEILSNGDELITLNSGIRVIKRGKEYLYQGDIILTPEQVDLLDSNTKGVYISDLAKRWGDQIVRYVIDDSRQDMIKRAMYFIEKRTNIKFEPRSNEPNYIQFTTISGSISNSQLGMVGGKQKINIGDDIAIRERTVMHEIYHALGVLHEQSRPDRDNYITINYDNIQQNHVHNFDIDPNAYVDGPFDFKSIMLYNPFTFAINNNIPTITKKDGTITYSSDTLTFGDISTINRMYQQPKCQIIGPSSTSYPRTLDYEITNIPTNPSNSYRVIWSVIPASAGVIISGGEVNSNKAKILINSATFSSINAKIIFSSSKYERFYTRNIPSFSVAASNLPIIDGINMYQYQQSDGEYTLELLCSNADIISSEWMCNGNAVLYDHPYSGDAYFASAPSYYKAIDFYSTGSYNVTVFGSSVEGMGSCTQSVYASTSKGAQPPFSFSPNPIQQGGSTELEFNYNDKNRSVDVSEVDITIYSDNKAVLKIKGSGKKSKLNLSTLPKGKYNISAKKDGKIYTSVIEIN